MYIKMYIWKWYEQQYTQQRSQSPCRLNWFRGSLQLRPPPNTPEVEACRRFSNRGKGFLIPKSLDWSQNLKTFPHICPHFSRFQEILALLPWRNRRNYLQRAAFPSPLRGGKSSGRPWNCRSVHFCTWHWAGCGLKHEELNPANHFIAVFINWDKYGITIPRTRLNIKNIVGHYQQCLVTRCCRLSF